MNQSLAEGSRPDRTVDEVLHEAVPHPQHVRLAHLRLRREPRVLSTIRLKYNYVPNLQVRKVHVLTIYISRLGSIYIANTDWDQPKIDEISQKTFQYVDHIHKGAPPLY